MYLTDVTIREAGQLPGREYTVEQKVAAAKALDDLGLEFVQATFPATGDPDRRVTRRLAEEIDANVVALARAIPDDVDACLESDAEVVEVFGTVSDLHLEHVVGRTREEMLDSFATCVERVRRGGAVPHVTLTDAFRTDVEHLVAVYDRLPGVDVITLADTVGSESPATVERFLSELSTEVDPDRIGVHFHDDLGVATANLLTAYEFGVRRGDVSVGSLGERAGNPALEEVVVNATRNADDTFGLETEKLIPVCREVLEELDEDVDPRKAILGEAVHEHEAGIHTRAMLEEPSTFEPFPPDHYGGERRLLFGPGTGASTVRTLLQQVTEDVTETDVAQLQEELRTEGPVELDEALSMARSTVEE